MNPLEREIHEFVCVRGQPSPLVPFFEELLTRYTPQEVFEATYRRYLACSDAEPGAMLLLRSSQQKHA